MKIPKDIRSTGRKRGRASLFKTRRRYSCTYCGVTCSIRPPDAPKNFEDFWPINEFGISATKSALQCNHLNKNLLDVDPVNLEWACASCHKLIDQTTDKGISVKDDEFGYD